MKKKTPLKHQDKTTQRLRNSSQRKHLLETTEEHNILALCEHIAAISLRTPGHCVSHNRIIIKMPQALTVFTEYLQLPEATNSLSIYPGRKYN